ncbi:MAG: type II secretion system protein GspM [Pseudomonadota bacterium]
MKKTWQKLSARIDSRTLRERAMLFCMTAGLLIFLVFFFFLNPSYARQKLALEQMARQQDRIASVEAEIAQTIEAHMTDPDAADKIRLEKVLAKSKALKTSLTAMQQGMVPAERMTALLEQMLRAHRGLRLKAMRTLPADSGAAPVLATATPAKAAPPQEQLLHKHSVELVLQGSYGDMVAYLSALETMQGQIFWENAAMAVDVWPNATLTLTVYTINLDKTWLTL